MRRLRHFVHEDRRKPGRGKRGFCVFVLCARVCGAATERTKSKILVDFYPESRRNGQGMSVGGDERSARQLLNIRFRYRGQSRTTDVRLLPPRSPSFFQTDNKSVKIPETPSHIPARREIRMRGLRGSTDGRWRAEKEVKDV